MHSDSSCSLFPSLPISPFSLSSSPSSLPPPQTFIPRPSSSATFLRLQNPNPNSTPRVLFIVAAPHHGGAAVLLRFWILRKSQSFSRAQVLCNQSGLKFDDNKLGVIFNVNHGVSIKLVGSINVFAMYSISNCKIWVFAAKMAGDEDDGVTVKLMKSAVIDCCIPVFSISISFEFFILGEENGVRIFPLRPLVKGRVRKHRRERKNLNDGLSNYKLMGQRLKFPNGVIQTINGSDDLFSDSLIRSYYGVSGHGSESTGGEGTGESSFNGSLEGKIDKHSDCVKLRPVKLRQDSKEGGACFVAFKSKNFESSKSTEVPLKSEKAISIEALSPNKFLVLDSVGDLHLLCLSNPVLGSEIPCQAKWLIPTMKVQNLAALPDTSMRTHTVWLSDGQHTIHVMAVSDMDTSVNDNDRSESEEKLMQISDSRYYSFGCKFNIDSWTRKHICICNFLKVLGRSLLLRAFMFKARLHNLCHWLSYTELLKEKSALRPTSIDCKTKLCARAKKPSSRWPQRYLMPSIVEPVMIVILIRLLIWIMKCGGECTLNPVTQAVVLVTLPDLLNLETRRDDMPEFNLREWALKARISRENTNSRRFSASNIKREDTRSFRSNFTISSTASSPGYTVREEIDPSTYSFTTALKALQARSAHSWDCLSPDGFALNSKWNEAEKYICNPLSGEVPMECLSAKTLSGRSFRRITMSAPLVYSSHSRLVHPKPFITTHEDDEVQFPIQEKKVWTMTRDVGTQSTPPELSSSSPSPAPTLPIKERSIKRVEDSPISHMEKLKSEKQVKPVGTKYQVNTKAP
ncbi:hypothetical protein F0562_004249 [Nyssa sinensis]|uniref:Uncharacterized protein n=1 Tax=Nyssa sinensis TaxID=561372 RepID=A0A5J5C0W8_9ASTE|nr:hypothetical protein F0562_004249 [Nyssa sinensis]